MDRENKEGAFDLARAKLSWARDPEVRIDIEWCARELWEWRADSSEIGRAVAQAERAVKMSAEELARETAPPNERILEVLALPSCKALHASRARWPKALALLGWIDLGEGERGAELAYERCARLALDWVCKRDPRFVPTGFDTAVRWHGRAQAMVDEGKSHVCSQALEALFDFGLELGVADPWACVAREARTRATALATLSGDGAPNGARKRSGREAGDALMSQVEALWLARSTRPEPGALAAVKAPLRM